MQCPHRHLFSAYNQVRRMPDAITYQNKLPEKKVWMTYDYPKKIALLPPALSIPDAIREIVGEDYPDRHYPEYVNVRTQQLIERNLITTEDKNGIERILSFYQNTLREIGFEGEDIETIAISMADLLAAIAVASLSDTDGKYSIQSITRSIDFILDYLTLVNERDGIFPSDALNVLNMVTLKSAQILLPSVQLGYDSTNTVFTRTSIALFYDAYFSEILRKRMSEAYNSNMRGLLLSNVATEVLWNNNIALAGHFAYHLGCILNPDVPSWLKRIPNYEEIICSGVPKDSILSELKEANNGSNAPDIVKHKISRSIEEFRELQKLNMPEFSGDKVNMRKTKNPGGGGYIIDFDVYLKRRTNSLGLSPRSWSAYRSMAELATGSGVYVSKDGAIAFRVNEKFTK